MNYRIHCLLLGLLMTATHVCGNPVTDMLEQAVYYKDHVLSAMNELRTLVDECETMTSSRYWPYPTYGELLFSVK